MSTANPVKHTSRSRKASRHSAKDMIDWEDLTEEQQQKFLRAFLSDEARFARQAILAGHSHGKRIPLALASLLHIYQEATHTRREICELDYTSPLRAKIEENLAATRHSILTHVWMGMVFGTWDDIRALAEYGQQHCPKGLQELT